MKTAPHVNGGWGGGGRGHKGPALKQLGLLSAVQQDEMWKPGTRTTWSIDIDMIAIDSSCQTGWRRTDCGERYRR